MSARSLLRIALESAGRPDASEYRHRMRCVVFTGAGGGEVVDVQERPDPVPGSGELLVRVRYAGLNPADLMQRAGHYPAPPGAPHFPGNLKALNPRGRIVVVGTGAGSSAQIELGLLMGKRAELHGTVLRARSLEDKGHALRAFEREVVPHLASGRMRPLVDRVYEAGRARDAYDRLAGSGKSGKVLLDFGG